MDYAQLEGLGDERNEAERSTALTVRQGNLLTEGDRIDPVANLVSRLVLASFAGRGSSAPVGMRKTKWLPTGLTVCFVALFGILSTKAHAGDGAGLHVFGFSPRGDRFAYEESGLQDGSGFAFDRIVVVDIARAAPVRHASLDVTVTDDAITFEQMQTQLRARADRALKNGGLSHYQAHLLAEDQSLRAFEYLSDDILRPACYSKAELELPAGVVGPQARLELFRPTAEAPSDARQIHVTLVRAGKGPTTLAVVPIHPDRRMNNVSPAAVYVSAPRRGRVEIAVILNECHDGFEGPDRRFLVAVGTIAAP
jgi:predicted secreted protein